MEGVGGCSSGKVTKEPFHVVHKIPAGDGSYVRAKHLQMVEKDLEGCIPWFWKAINERDRVDSALKDMALVMKQQNRAEEAIEAIKSFRHLCSKHSQDSLDNILIDLYKKCGKVAEQIVLLKQKLRMIYTGEAFNGRSTKSARCHGKKFQVSIKQETSRLLSNLGWAYIQQGNYIAAEAVYRKAQMIDHNPNTACNMALCLIKQERFDEAREVLSRVIDDHQDHQPTGKVAVLDGKPVRRAEELLRELESQLFTEMNRRLEEMILLNNMEVEGHGRWSSPFASRRLPVFEEISSYRDQMAC